MPTIQLSRGYEAVVDDEDYDRLSQYKWYAFVTSTKVYAARTVPIGNGQRRTIYMHRVIIDPPDDMQTDHIDGNGLNNCRANLRICSHGDNAKNRLTQTNTSSIYKGVVRHPQCKERWIAQIGVDGGKRYLGLYTTQEEAARAYDRAARELHGEFARLNFCENTPPPNNYDA